MSAVDGGALVEGVAVGALIVAGMAVARRDRRLRRFAEHSERERAWTAFRARRDAPISGAGVEYACRCGHREVVAEGALPPTCAGVSCIGTEHEPRVMHGEEGP
jgi:hypothetical protein